MIQTVPDSGLKPCARPRFDAGNRGAAITSAIRASAHLQGLPCYVYPMAWGYRITWNRGSLPVFHPFTMVTATYDRDRKTYSVEISQGKGGDR